MTEKEIEELKTLGVNVDAITSEGLLKVHLLNIGVAVVMIIIGGLLLFKTRKEKSSGKKTAGWILIGIGITVTVVHIVQMLA